MRLLRGARHHDPSAAPKYGRGAALSLNEQVVLLWGLSAWTWIQVLAALFADGTIARGVCGGMRDASGRHLLGVELLLPAVLYSLLALGHLDRRSLLGWAPLVLQAGTALVTFIATLSGGRSFAATGLLFFISLGFALLLAGFKLAGEPYIRPPDGPEKPAGGGTPTFQDARTERLDLYSRQSTPSTRPPDDDVLGV